MARRQRPRKITPRAADERRRTRRVAAVLAVTLALLSAGLFTAWYLGQPRPQPGGEGHPHGPAPHGGAVVPVGEEALHRHAEAVLERGGFLTLYTLGEDAEGAAAVGPQVVTAFVRPPAETEATAVSLMPVPQPGDAPGKTSRFLGKLPRELWCKSLVVSVPDLIVAGGRYRLEFAAASAGGGQAAAWAKDEEALYLDAGGKYTQDDIRANGGQTAAQKYRGFETDHGRKPAPGDRVCPVTGLKADPGCSWVIGGKSYAFCCPPCVDQFVRTAKERPGEVRDPREYLAR
jgi:hypothetical protein